MGEAISEDWRDWCLVHRDRIARENIRAAFRQGDLALVEIMLAEYNSQPWAQYTMGTDPHHETLWWTEKAEPFSSDTIHGNT